MTSEKTLQNEFARQVEVATSRKVLTWNQAMSHLKGGDGKVRTGHRQILMESDPTNGVVGLVEGIGNVNRHAFEQLREDWARKAQDPKNMAGPVPSMETLSRKAAEKFAALWEGGAMDPSKTGAYRILLAYGCENAWLSSKIPGKPNGDPRVLAFGDIPGWPKHMSAVPFRVVHAEETLPFMDLGIPQWVDPAKLGSATQQAEMLRRWAPRNAYTWIREFLVETLGGREERADFTMFVHGLPILWVEMKIPGRLAEAARNFLEKDTYKGAPLRLMVDGEQAILTALGEGNLEKWYVGSSPIGHPGYGMPVNGKAPGIKGGQAYLVGQVLAQPERFEFLVRRCGYFDDAGRFMVPRSQQYEALANLWRDLLWSACSQQDITDRLVRHTQRTGKTSTMIRAVRMALSERGPFDSAFDLAMLMVGETNIIDQIAKAFLNKNTGLLDGSLAVDEIKSRKGLREALAKQYSSQGAKRVILANTQKLESLDSEKMDEKKLEGLLKEAGADQGTRLRSLVVLDESHLSQHGGMANMRRMLLPGATHLLLTATPKAQMATYYGITQEEQILDDFGFHEAREAGIVVPVLFERHNISAQVTPDRLDDLAKALGMVRLDGKTAGDLEVDDNIPSAQLNGVDRKTRKRLVGGVLDKIDEELTPTRLSIVIDRINKIEANLQDDLGRPRFYPKAMIFCRSVAQAKQIIGWIQKQNELAAKASGTVCPDYRKNIYRNKRFGVDVSNFGSGDASDLTKLNPGVHDPDVIKERFESEDPDTRIDILLAVGKYTKGYDNSDLCLVALFKAIKEPSLINQIYTRPATKRAGKESGVCLDLTLGSANVESWKESMGMYDRAGAGHFYDEQGCQNLVDTLRQQLRGAAAAIYPTWNEDDLGEGTNLGRAVDQLHKGGLAQSSAFIHHVDQACETIEKLPDAVVLHPLRMPLIGMKYILSRIRILFPELDRSPVDVGIGGQHNTNSSNNESSLLSVDPATLGEQIDRAIKTLGQDSLSQFLSLTHLGSHLVVVSTDGDEVKAEHPESQALAAKRTEEALQNSVATARAILRAIGGKLATEEDDDEQKVSDNERQETPEKALRQELEAALKRLLGIQAKGDLIKPDNRSMAEQVIVQVQAEIQKLLALHSGGDFITLLTHEIREELRRRWTLLDLPADGLSLFEPLVVVAGQRWGHDFKAWRERSGHHVRSVDPADLVSMWIQNEHAHSTSLTTWLGVCSQQHPEWQSKFVAFVSEQGLNSGLLRAAMGDSNEAEATQGQPGLLDMAGREAGRNLSLLEASQAWVNTIVRHAD